MIRTALLSLALLASPAAAAQYHAQPAAKPAETRLVVRDLIWRCGDAGCFANANGSRAAIACSTLARQVGPLNGFAAAGRAFDATELEKCNARAR